MISGEEKENFFFNFFPGVSVERGPKSEPGGLVLARPEDGWW